MTERRERRAEIVTSRGGLLLSVAVLLSATGAAVAIVPTIASSETSATVVAVNHAGTGIYGEGETHAWSPAQVTVAANGALTFSNPSATVEHGLVWAGGPATPSCTGVPVGQGKADWSGTCTFSQPGTYKFYCYVHPTEMTGTVTVAADGSTTTTTTQPTAPVAGPTAPTAPGSSGSPSAPGSPLQGSPARAVKFAASQRGGSVRGLIEVSPAGAGGRLEVDLLASGSSLAKTKHPAKVRVGRLVRASLRSGPVSFAVPLNARAGTALRHRRRLALTVRIVLKPVAGAATTVSKSVVLHA
jgi:plastocyanin